ncbi:uncharacterized protein BYT42DRAFT_568689 [Radiomyces spectabilis]|uniref:uncharacterized protein n=1 Tax=Radiomyces spectabilis TaxID=64574 RepID=UPI00221FC2DA|nr:uncharacterized protein BYT42DRAFT_568689 [Radiomyces spectabilis]KAI8379406.1 hypothetical protein BYT42DRAFT_568689 [Radiomyces spectabilis]
MYPYPNQPPQQSGAQPPHPQGAQGYPPPPPSGNYGGVPTAEFGQMNLSESQHHHPHFPHFHAPSFSNHSPFHRHNEPVEVVCGPLLRYIDIDYRSRTWRGSCLVVSTERHTPSMQVKLQSASGRTQTIQSRGEELDTFRHQYRFWRFELRLPLINESQVATYSCSGVQKEYSFHLPTVEESMRFMFYSCNGFSDIPQELKDKFGEKTAPLWQDVLDRHEVMPFHVMIGGGDQLYQDRLMKEDFMKPWREEKDPKIRMAMQLPATMRDGLEHFYFWNYVQNFGFKDNPVVAFAFASIPSVNMWDDHDIIDGYGSYPAEMQRADMFQVLFANACRFYYLFQQHTTVELAPRHGMLRGTLPTCNSIVTTLGPSIGLVQLDCRGERTKFDVCRPKTYDGVFEALYNQMPPTVKHLLIATGVPLIYPRLTLFEKAMDGAAGFNLATLVGKTGALGEVISGQLNKWNGDPELLDDMNDHWTAGNHEVERKNFIERLQQYARDRSIRVSFLGGDVHCCGAGKLYSKDMKDKEEGDPFLMVQIISSAIVNVPPPQALLTILNQNSSFVTFNGNTEERMYNLFKRSPNGNTRQNKKLMGMRNYCAGYLDEETGKMNFWIQAEKEVGKKGTMGYLVDVPKLLFGQAGYHLHVQQKPPLSSSTYSSLPPPPPASGNAPTTGGFVMPPRPEANYPYPQ